jgi:pSer/pThr/pTyr-binding forkhead associated (FHA) protein
MNGIGELLIGSVKDTWGNALFNNHMLLYLEISGVVSTIVLHPSQRIVLGRLREEQACERILDLTPYDARQNGVSRVHASITQQGHTLWLSDLGSTNGTYLNDQRLLLNQPRLLRDGDHIFLGNLSALVRFG